MPRKKYVPLNMIQFFLFGHYFRLNLPKPVFGRRFAVYLGNKLTNKRFLIECSEICTKKIMPNTINTMMIKLFARAKNSKSEK